MSSEPLTAEEITALITERLNPQLEPLWNSWLAEENPEEQEAKSYQVDLLLLCGGALRAIHTALSAQNHGPDFEANMRVRAARCFISAATVLCGVDGQEARKHLVNLINDAMDWMKSADMAPEVAAVAKKWKHLNDV